jgi:hypothetical protein
MLKSSLSYAVAMATLFSAFTVLALYSLLPLRAVLPVAGATFVLCLTLFNQLGLILENLSAILKAILKKNS